MLSRWFESARAKLVVLDRRDPGSARQIAIDQHPGTESLHPVMRSVTAVSDDAIAWFAQSGDSDVLHVRPRTGHIHLFDVDDGHRLGR